MEKKVLMFAGDFVEDYELMVPFQALQSIGVKVDVVCPDKEAGSKIATAIHDFVGFQTYQELRGHNFVINKTFSEVNPKEYDGLFITGGRAPEYIRLNSKILEITRYFFEKNKAVAAICHGIQILTAAQVINGKILTCYETVAPEVNLAGGIYKKIGPDQVLVDGNLATSPAWPGNASLLTEFYKLLGIKIS